MAHSEIINGDDLGTREASEKVSKVFHRLCIIAGSR